MKERMMSAGTVIVGGGHGGAHAAYALRQLGYNLPITIITDERVPPYERPPLSKEYLAGEKPFERLLIRPASFWNDRNIALLLGERVVELSPSCRNVRTNTDRIIAFEHLIWAAGGIPR